MKPESFNPDNEFHRAIHQINNNYGKGQPTIIFWDSSPQPEGTANGMVVCQLNYGMNSRRFCVFYTDTQFTLRFLTRTQIVNSRSFKAG